MCFFSRNKEVFTCLFCTRIILGLSSPSSFNCRIFFWNKWKSRNLGYNGCKIHFSFMQKWHTCLYNYFCSTSKIDSTLHSNHRRTQVGRIAARISRTKRVSLHKKYGAPVFIAAVFLLSRTTTLETFSRGSVMF